MPPSCLRLLHSLALAFFLALHFLCRLRRFCIAALYLLHESLPLLQSRLLALGVLPHESRYKACMRVWLHCGRCCHCNGLCCCPCASSRVKYRARFFSCHT